MHLPEFPSRVHEYKYRVDKEYKGICFLKLLMIYACIVDLAQICITLTDSGAPHYLTLVPLAFSSSLLSIYVYFEDHRLALKSVFQIWVLIITWCRPILFDFLDLHPEGKSLRNVSFALIVLVGAFTINLWRAKVSYVLFGAAALDLLCLLYDPDLKNESDSFIPFLLHSALEIAAYMLFIFFYESECRQRFLESTKNERLVQDMERLLEKSPIGTLICNDQGEIVEKNKVIDEFLELSHQEVGCFFDNLVKCHQKSPSASPRKEISNFQTLRELLPTLESDPEEILPSSDSDRSVWEDLGEFFFSHGKDNRDFKILSVMTQIIQWRARDMVMVLCKDVTDHSLYCKSKEIVDTQAKLLQTVSHDIRAPLGTIGAMLENLREFMTREGGENSRQQKWLEVANSASRLLVFYANDLLDFFQIQRNCFTILNNKMSLGKCVRETVDLLKLKADEKKIELTVEIEVSNEEINNDYRRIQQIVLNLLSNAIKFTPYKESIRVKVFDDQDNGLIGVEVKDTGIGIKDEEKANLFREFGRILNDENRALNPEGVGMGLVISDTLSKLVGEGLFFESSYKKGSRFWFYVRPNNTPHEVIDEEESLDLEQNTTTVDDIDSCIIAEDSFDETRDFEPMNFGNLVKSRRRVLFNTPKITESPVVLQKRSSKSGYNQLDDLFKVSAVTFAREGQRRASDQCKRLSTLVLGDVKKVLTLPALGRVASWNGPSLDSGKVNWSNPSSLSQLALQLCNCPQVLIVDDEPFNALTLEILLEKYNIQCHAVGSAEEALETIHSRSQNCICSRFKMILIDRDLPKMNGPELVKVLEDKYATGILSRSPLIGFTASTSEPEIREFKQAGLFDILPKPVDNVKLEELVNACCQ